MDDDPLESSSVQSSDRLDLRARRLRTQTVQTRSFEDLVGGADDGRTLAAELGRYVVLQALGRGGMGAVFSAYDRQLDRKVALKILHRRRRRRTELDKDANADAGAWLAREARSLARLSHPNVVQVYEITEHEGTPYIAMELIEGQDLRTWANDTARSWQEILTHLVQAGRGLVAAHEVGLLHRDFKPTNALLGRDDRVRVVDFGLAKPQPADEDPEPLDPIDVSDPASASPEDPQTRAGKIVGTLPYMAPEQHEPSTTIGPAVDQYAFCVTAWELLCGARPFKGTRQALLRQKLDGPPPWPTSVDVPRRIAEVLRRGLAALPQDRWPSMAALLDELEPRAPRWRWLVGLGVAFLGGGALASLPGLMREETCTGAHAQLERVWDDDARSRVEHALLASKLTYAAPSWSRVEAELDGYASQWVDMHTQACEDAIEQSQELLDLRMACLDQRLRTLETTVEALSQADAAVVERAVDLVAELPRLDPCADVTSLRAAVPEPEDPELAQQLQALRTRLDHASVQRHAGRFDDALAELRGLDEPVRSLGHGPLIARLAFEEGMVLHELGKLEPAAEQLEHAFVTAVASDANELAVDAASELAEVVAVEQGHAERGRTWAAAALALARRRHQEATLEARALVSSSMVLRQLGDAPTAVTQLQRAVELLEAVPHAPPLPLAELGSALHDVGRYDEAKEVFDRTLGLAEQRYGPEHPRTIDALNNLGVMLLWQGRHHQSIAVLERGLDRAEAIWSAAHPQTRSLLINLGAASMHARAHEAARGYLERAVAMAEELHGPTHPSVARGLNTLARALDASGEQERAMETVRRSVEIGESTLGPKHPELARFYTTLGTLLANGDHPEDAAAAYRHALEILEGALGRDHPEVALTLRDLAELHLDEGRPDDAEPVARRALEIHRASVGDSHPDTVAAHFTLGRALDARGHEAEARAELQEVMRRRDEGDIEDSNMVAYAREWLAAHPEPSAPP
ncbi:serine/threonine-protein kinase [Paraliomyxa miuraensis]|uniref:serine/threonine-protein kinase n=1 Tax=Paraliomyxa miuraensis TaxID=376150 RepID=UPI0022557B51|nr:serine/threonine-protein kinase [Paraliomyxa miuraensis]MCX4242552.1 serine/threonine-protein kinase [Paraliomyxa miuraensis]